MLMRDVDMGVFERTTKNLIRRKTRTAIIIIALTFALTLLIVLPPSVNERTELTQHTITVLGEWSDNVASDVTLSLTEIKCEYGMNNDINTLLNTEHYYSTYSLMNQSLYQSIVSIPDVNTVIPILEDLSTANRAYSIYGVPLSDSSYSKDPDILSHNITMGRNLQVGDSGVIVIDEIIAKNFSWASIDFASGATFEEAMVVLNAKDYAVHIGDSFEISGRKFTVVGIEAYSLDTGSHGVTMSLEDARSVTGKTGMSSKYLIFVDNVDSVSPVVARIQNLDPKLLTSAGYLQLNMVSELLNQIDVATNSAQNTLTSIQGIGTAEIALAAIVVIAIILFMMLYSVRERTREIGTLKAMGASNSTIIGQFIFEGMLLCLIAVVIALVISVFVMPPVSNALLPAADYKIPFLSSYPNGTRFLDVEFTQGYAMGIATPAAVTLELALFAVGLAVLLGALGSLYPALKAARTKPSEAMRYE